MQRAPVNLLWTGGWDSTFRLLDLVLLQGRKVQPYYVLDRQRGSIETELATMEAIKAAIAERSQAARLLIAQTHFVEKWAIGPDPIITAAHQRIRARGRLGDQYDWLARFAHQQALNGLELSVEIGGSTEVLLRSSLRQDGDAMVFVDAPEDSDLRVIFRRFRFPLIHLTKRDMERLAKVGGFLDILELSWFCFRPYPGPQPCGYCVSCNLAIKKGMGRRISWGGHIRHHLWRMIAPARPLARHMRMIIGAAAPGAANPR